MAARYELLLDSFLRRADVLLDGKDLFLGGDVIGFASEQIDRASDILQVQAPAETDKRAPDKPILFEEFSNDLEIPATGQIYRMFVPKLKNFFLN